MNSVGIDISKGRSTIAVMRPFGEVVISPFEVRHTDSELSELAKQLKSLNGETRVVMEATGNYHAPVAKLIHDAGLYSGQWRWSKDRSIAAFGGVAQDCFQMRQVRSGDLLGTGKLAEKCVNRCHVKCRNQLFQLREQNRDQTGNRLLQLRSFTNLVKTVSCE